MPADGEWGFNLVFKVLKV